MKELIIIVWYLGTLILFSCGFFLEDDISKKIANYWGSISVTMMLFVSIMLYLKMEG